MPALSVHMSPWPEQYRLPYFYATKQLGWQQQSPASPVGYVSYFIDVNVAPLHFLDSASSQLIQSQTPGLDQLGTRSLFAGMSQSGETTYDDADMEMMEIIHDGDRGGGGFEDGQVDDSKLKLYRQQPGTYTQPGDNPQV